MALVAGPPLPVIEEVAGASVVTDEELPLMKAWFGRFLAVDAVRAALPDRDRLLAANKARREQLPLLKTGQKFWQKISTAVATGTNVTHQYRLQNQLIPLASGDQR